MNTLALMLFSIDLNLLAEQIKATSVVVSNTAAEVAFSKRSNTPEFVQTYAEALQALVADGSYEHIVRRYITP